MSWEAILREFGLPIALIGLILIGRFVPGKVYDERKAELDVANAEIRRLNNVALEEWVPALARQATIFESAMKLLEEMRLEKTIRDNQRLPRSDREIDGLDR